MIRNRYQCGDGGALGAGLHGNRRPGQPWLTERGRPHTAQEAIYNSDPYYKTAQLIHNCSVRAPMLGLCATWRWESKRKMSVRVPSVLRSNHRGDTVDWVADDWENIYMGKLLLCEQDIITSMSHEITLWDKNNIKSTLFHFLTALESSEERREYVTFNFVLIPDWTNNLIKNIPRQYCVTHLQWGLKICCITV